MTFAALLIIAGLAVWGWLYARQAQLPIVVLTTVIVAYVLGPSFLSVKIGPAPVTLDRLMLAALSGLFAWRWWTGRVTSSAIAGVDWALALTLAWLTGSALLSQPDDPAVLGLSPLWRLMFCFWAPALLFLVGRQSSVSAPMTKKLLWMLTILGVYLALMAIAETAGCWSLVFPRYIADPTLGLHFGRARGPGLNSVSLGIFLGVCIWAPWLLLPRANRAMQLALLLTIPLMAFALLLTYTRSTWLGLIASAAVVLAVQLPRRLRLPVLSGVGLAGLLLAGAMWQSVLYLEREDSGNVSKHSVQQRTAFAYVSWKMMQDHPLWGVGFGRFYDQKMPYLSDRTQSFELESLRKLQHHNTLLSILTETGMIGLAAYMGVLGGLLTCAWRLGDSDQAEPHQRALGVLTLATVMAYLPSAVFHDLTLLYTVQWLLLAIGGLAVGCERRLVATASPTLSAAENLSPANPHPAF